MERFVSLENVEMRFRTSKAEFHALRDVNLQIARGEILHVDLPRPRDRLQLVNDSRYHQLRTQVLQFLYERHARPVAA